MTDLEFNNAMTTARGLRILDNVTAAFPDDFDTVTIIRWADHLAWAAACGSTKDLAWALDRFTYYTFRQTPYGR